MTAAGDCRPRALVLHDDRAMATHIHGLLAAEGFDVQVVDNALRVMGAVLAHTPTREAHARDIAAPELVVLAATALDRRDHGLVALLREHAAAATILVLFPANLRDVAAEMLAAGADATLLEPFYPGEITAHARRALALGAAPEPAGSGDVLPAATSGATPVQQIAVGVAHAVRNPLQIMELMIAGAEAGDELDLVTLREMMTRIAGVTADLARFADHRRSERRPVEVESLVREIFSAVPDTAAPTVLLEVPQSHVVVMAEKELLRTAVELLRDRALRRTQIDGSIGVRVSVEGSTVTIAVSDGGDTPDEAALAHFFEPDPDMGVVQRGYWLELAAFAGMVHAQGGAVDVAPGPETGITVTIRLQAADGAADGA